MGTFARIARYGRLILHDYVTGYSTFAQAHRSKPTRVPQIDMLLLNSDESKIAKV